MTTWRGVVRSMAAAERARERERQRQHRAWVKQQHAAAKRASIAEAAQVVAQHEALLRQLVTVHVGGSAPYDWQALANSPAPAPPPYVPQFEQEARVRLDGYKPGILDRLLGRVEKRRAELASWVEHARQRDYGAHQEATAAHQTAVQEWQWQTDLAREILGGKLSAYKAAMENFFPAGIDGMSGEVSCRTDAPWFFEATIEVRADDDLLPDEIPTQQKSGALSWKKLPPAKYNELYQDHVCSCLLRVAWELFALLPISTAVVHVQNETLNTATGNVERAVILSAAPSREAFTRLNPERLDPSDSMANFPHNMSFTARAGFKPVERLDPWSFAPAGQRNLSM